MPSNARQHPREQVTLRVDYMDSEGRGGLGLATNLSYTGIALTSLSPPLQVGVTLVLTFVTSHSSWVATRRGLTKPVSSSPPFKTGLAAFTAPGSTPLIALHGVTMERRFPFLQFHGCPPVYSLRVHWVPLFPSSQRLGAFALSPHPGVRGFPTLRLRCPIRLSSLASRFREAFPPHSFPTALGIHRGVSRVPHGRLKQNEVGGVFLSLPQPLFAAPQALDRG